MFYENEIQGVKNLKQLEGTKTSLLNSISATKTQRRPKLFHHCRLYLTRKKYHQIVRWLLHFPGYVRVKLHCRPIDRAVTTMLPRNR